jgi:hypothetical protein
MAKINVEVTERQISILLSHKEETRSTISNTVRVALNLYFKLYKAEKEGAQFFIKRSDENTQELIISGL